MSSASSVNEVLAGFLAGGVSAERVVTVVAAAYYGERGAGSREWLKPIIEVIEKAHPGIVALSASAETPGFAVRPAERPFPKRYQGELREAIETALTRGSSVRLGDIGARHVVPLQSDIIASEPTAGIWFRMVQAVRRLFTAST